MAEEKEIKNGLDLTVKTDLIDLEEFQAIKKFLYESSMIRIEEFKQAGENPMAAIQVTVTLLNDYGRVTERLIEHLEAQEKQKHLN